MRSSTRTVGGPSLGRGPARVLRERAVRMVFEHAHEYPSQGATMRSVAEKLGCTTEALACGCAKRTAIADSVPAGAMRPSWPPGACSPEID
jgi:hypothetical protein